MQELDGTCTKLYLLVSIAGSLDTVLDSEKVSDIHIKIYTVFKSVNNALNLPLANRETLKRVMLEPKVKSSSDEQSHECLTNRYHAREEYLM